MTVLVFDEAITAWLFRLLSMQDQDERRQEERWKEDISNLKYGKLCYMLCAAKPVLYILLYPVYREQSTTDSGA